MFCVLALSKKGSEISVGLKGDEVGADELSLIKDEVDAMRRRQD